MLATFPDRRTTWVALGAGAAALVGTLAVFATMLGDHPSAVLWTVPFLGSYTAGVLSFRLRPDLLAARRLLLLGAVATAFNGSAVALALAVDRYGAQSWLEPANTAVQLLGLAQGAAGLGLLAIYPDGTYSRRYEARLVRTVAALALVVPLLLLVAGRTLHPSWVFAWGSGTDFPRIESPLHVPALSFLAAPLRFYLDAALALPLMLGAVVVGLRYRRLPADQRLQLRWPMYGVLAVLLAPLGVLLDELGALPPAVADLLVVGGLGMLPAAVAVGLLRPDLFDVDRAMRRSLLYLPLWIAIAGAYVGAAAALGLAASSAGLQITVAVTILATVFIEPARRRLVRRAARWARIERLSGEELLRRLGTTLDHTLDTCELATAIAAVTREGLGARWVRLRLADGVVLDDGEVAGEPTLRAELVHGGERLGTLECGPRRRGQDSDQALLDTLARQAALALSNASLAAALRERLTEIHHQAAELAASRSRIVAAQESARRRIERDIHDGAQQELVALIARIGLARTQHGASPDRLGATLEDLRAEAEHALDSLRELASGVHPAVLSDHGLVHAIESRAARLPIGVTVDCTPELRAVRWQDEVEGAAYFFASEAIANALKHSGAAHVRVEVRRSAEGLELEVVDDGRGFEPGTASGSGLRGLADRLEALGGSLEVCSRQGGGTCLVARLPTGAPAVA